MTKATGMEKLRKAVRALNYCNESFLDRFTVTELLCIHDAWLKSDWDIVPDDWEDQQVTNALFGIVPQWDDNEKPIYVGQSNLTIVIVV